LTAIPKLAAPVYCAGAESAVTVPALALAPEFAPVSTTTGGEATPAEPASAEADPASAEAPLLPATAMTSGDAGAGAGAGMVVGLLMS